MNEGVFSKIKVLSTYWTIIQLIRNPQERTMPIRVLYVGRDSSGPISFVRLNTSEESIR